MKKKKIISIIIFPGSNCDRDLMIAIKRNLGVKPNLIWHQTRNIEKNSFTRKEIVTNLKKKISF